MNLAGKLFTYGYAVSIPNINQLDIAHGTFDACLVDIPAYPFDRSQ